MASLAKGGRVMSGESFDAAALRAVAVLLDAQHDPSAEVAFWRQLCREGYEAGRAEGWRQGYEQGARLRQAEWPRVIAVVARDGWLFAELERRRWGPEGRHRFGDPRPDDRFPRLEAAS